MRVSAMRAGITRSTLRAATCRHRDVYKRQILDYVEEPLAELIVEGGVQSGETICVTCRDGKVELTVERGVPEKQASVS